MLTELKVNQFAIIENLHIQFQDGLNIISGETGAGKSVLLRSLSLLMGAKASSDFIRTGSQQAQIEGCFDLSHREDILNRLVEFDISTGEKELIVRRIIGPGDKNKVYLNHTLCTLSALRDIVAPLIEVAGKNAPLIEMTGQHENKNLLNKSYHLDLLDQFANTLEEREVFETHWYSFKETKNQIDRLEQNDSDRLQRLDFLNFQKKELESFSLKEGEDLELENRVKRLRQKQRITQFYASAIQIIDEDEGAVTTRLQKIIQKGNEFIALEPALEMQLKYLEQALNLIREGSFSINKALDDINNEDTSLNELEEQLSQWRKIQKKYGPSLSDVREFQIKVKNELDDLENREKKLQTLKNQLQTLIKDLEKRGRALHQRRESAGKTLVKEVNDHLKDLNMKGVTFGLRVVPLSEPSPSGLSEVEFLTQTSPDDPPRPLSKVASGGELSRILLSLKCVLGKSQFPRTYLFDEVDSGVSGNTADKVARKLKKISQGQQVICVTHLPQVAALGDHHFAIQKSPSETSVQMEIQKLKGEARIQEMARLLSGETITKTSLAHAKQLLKRSP